MQLLLTGKKRFKEFGSGKYVRTKYGLIPEDWKLQKLRILVGTNSLISDGDWIETKDQNPNGTVRLIQLADIGDGCFLNRSSRYLTNQKAEELKCTYLEEGDILVARMPDPLGRACMFPKINSISVTAVDVCIIRIATQVDTQWLIYCINSPLVRKDISRKACGTTRSRISRSSLEKLLLPTPSIREQKKIASVLNTADREIELLNKKLESLKQQKTGLMQKLLTGKIRVL